MEQLQLTLRHGDLKVLVDQLKNQRMLRHDMVVPATSLMMNDDKTITVIDAPPPPSEVDATTALGAELKSLGLTVQADGPFDQAFHLLEMAEGQFASRLSIPKRYWNLLSGSNMPLLALNVNGRLAGPGGIADTQDGNFLVRAFRPVGTGTGTIRALLSDRYKVLDNLDLLFTTLQTLKKLGAPIDSNDIRCNLTERRMYVQIQCPSVSITARELLQGYRNPETGSTEGGHRMYAGLVLSNSETGAGAFQVMPRPYARCCMNAFTYRADALRKVHLGIQLEEGAIDWSEDTRRKNLELIESQVKDAVETFLSEEYLTKLSMKFREQAMQTLRHPTQALKNYATHLGISETEQDDIMKYFYKSGQDDRAIGLVNAVTFHAQKVEDADRQYDIEDAALEALAYVNRFDVPAKEAVTS